jgi:two-component system cell cycle sensor histidine kinase/response regulator CckA
MRRFGKIFARRKPTRLIDVLARDGATPADAMVRLLFDDAGAASLVADRDGRIVRANTALQHLLGATGLLPGAPLDALFASGEHVSGRHPPREFTTQLRGANGVVAVSVVVHPVNEVDGSVSGAILHFSDLTRLQKLEAQLAQSQRLQEVGQLAGGIAHDFNNLLTTVLGAAESITSREALDAETLDDAAQIQASAMRGASLVQQLLAFGRQQTLQPRVLAINEVITDTARLLRRLLGEKVRLELDLETPGRAVRADRTQLDQVLVNLAVNARDAMPDGGVLTLRTGHLLLLEPISLGADTLPPGRYAMIEVADTGAGISPELLSHIFEPFFTTKREQGGTGLGLATVHGIVRQSGGHVKAESEPGKGTRMRIYLPRWEDAGESDTEQTPPRPPVAPPPSHAAPRAVLLVEDEEPVRRLAERTLARQGWRVLAAETGEAALALLDAETAGDLAAVVTDMVMPGMDGNALVRAVRERLRSPELPAIIVSGYAEATLRDGLETTAVTFLAKPYTLKDITRALETAAAQAAAART